MSPKVKIGGIVLAALLLIGLGYGIRAYRQHQVVAGADDREAARMVEFNKLQTERNQLLGENTQLRREVTEIKTERAAQDQIIAAKGGDIAVQDQKIEEAKKQYEAKDAEIDKPMDAHTRCELLKQLYVQQRIKRAEQIDCNAVVR